MIVFKYTKCDGAEYISHLDTLRHLNKIIKRAGIDIGFSKGFNPHMHIFMSAPMPLGVPSECEYCTVETQENPEEFVEKFNAYTVNGIRCTYAVATANKVSVAGLISRATYRVSGINRFDVQEVLNSAEFFVTDKRGNVQEVRRKIFDLRFENDVLYATLGFGNDTLRIDNFANKLARLYGGGEIETVKIAAFAGEKDFDLYLAENCLKN